jgi:hypothetical protein
VQLQSYARRMTALERHRRLVGEWAVGDRHRGTLPPIGTWKEPSLTSLISSEEIHGHQQAEVPAGQFLANRLLSRQSLRAKCAPVDHLVQKKNQVGVEHLVTDALMARQVPGGYLSRVHPVRVEERTSFQGAFGAGQSGWSSASDEDERCAWTRSPRCSSSLSNSALSSAESPSRNPANASAITPSHGLSSLAAFRRRSPIRSASSWALPRVSRSPKYSRSSCSSLEGSRSTRRPYRAETPQRLWVGPDGFSAVHNVCGRLS